MSKYAKVKLDAGKWVITTYGHDYKKPIQACTFAIDTETQTYFDGKLLDANKLFKKVKNLNNDEKRKRLHNVTWAWQAYDEYNGFFMTNDFNTYLQYHFKLLNHSSKAYLLFNVYSSQTLVFSFPSKVIPLPSSIIILNTLFTNSIL